MVRLIVRVNPAPPYGQLFVILRVFFTLDYEYVCPETDFTQEKSHVHPTTKITIPPYCLLLLCHKIVG